MQRLTLLDALHPELTVDLDKIRRAVEMTAQCREVSADSRRPADSLWSASLWCNAIGQHVFGDGPDAWTAVQAAHAEHARYTSNPHLKPPF